MGRDDYGRHLQKKFAVAQLRTRHGLVAQLEVSVLEFPIRTFHKAVNTLHDLQNNGTVSCPLPLMKISEIR